MVTQEQMDHYLEKGWVVIEGVFDHAVVDGIAKTATTIIEEEIKNPDVSALAGERLESGEVIPRKIFSPFFKHPSFQEFVLDDRFNNVIEEFLGDTPLLLKDQVFMKPPYHGGPVPYHQDNFHFQCFPADQVITAWVALDDVNEENACLRYISGSHKEGIIPHYQKSAAEPHSFLPREEDIKLKNEELAPVHKGGVVFHQIQTLHSSHRNYSDRWRRAYVTHWVTGEVTCKNETLNQALFKTDRYQAVREKRAVSPKPASGL
jgi:phytanoyl-CoA hydroxylase